MIKLGSRLNYALDTHQPDLLSSLEHGRPILIDNHGCDMDLMRNIDRIIQRNAYKSVLIHPYIDKPTFEQRLIERWRETGRDYDIKSYWNQHLLFHKSLSNYMSYNTPFNTIIVYDNSQDDDKPLIYVEHTHNYTLSNYYPINMDKINEIIDNGNHAQNLPYAYRENNLDLKFISKPNVFHPTLEELFQMLLDDLIKLDGINDRVNRYSESKCLGKNYEKFANLL